MTSAPLQHVSTFSGVGGVDLAFARAGIETVAACEIDKHARGVLADRYPHAHLFDDVKDVTANALLDLGLDPGRTVLSGGFPCQDLSVAGARRGLGEGTRSGLYWQLDRIMAEFRPGWVVFENVPGLLSATCACPGDGTCEERGLARECPLDGEAHAVTGGACWGECIARHGGVMGAVLGSLGERGYGFAYRVLDAQHFGVPQRRRRVIIVGRLGDDGRAPASVLLEPEGVSGDPCEGITPGPRPAPTARGGIVEGGPVGSLTAHHGRLDDNQASQLVVTGVLGDVAHTLTAEGHDASEDGTGRGTPIIAADNRRAEAEDAKPVAFHHQQEPISGDMSPAIGASTYGMGVAYMAEQAGTLQASQRGVRLDAEGAASGQLVAYAAETVGTIDTRQGGTDVKEAQDGRLVAYAIQDGRGMVQHQNGLGIADEGEPAYTLTAQAGQAVATTYQKVTRPASSDHPDVWEERDVAATLSPFDLGSDSRTVEVVLAPTLTASLGEGGWAGHNRKDEMVERTFEAGATVRRLTPRECERLQGFPDDHTLTSNGKRQADSQRYKQMGNAVAVPVFEWVGRRLAAVDAALDKREERP